MNGLLAPVVAVVLAAPACGGSGRAAAPACVDDVLAAFRSAVAPAAGGVSRASYRDAAEVARECQADAEARCSEALEALESRLRAAAGAPARSREGGRARLEGAAAGVVTCDA